MDSKNSERLDFLNKRGTKTRGQGEKLQRPKRYATGIARSQRRMGTCYKSPVKSYSSQLLTGRYKNENPVNVKDMRPGGIRQKKASNN